MSDKPSGERRRSESRRAASPARRSAPPANDGRPDRRAARGAARRRKRRTRLWLVAAPTVAIIAVVVVLLVLFGGPDAQQTVGTTSTTVVAPTPEGALLAVEEAGSLELAVVFQAREAGGVVLVVPGLALLRDGDRFITLAEVRAKGDDRAFSGVLGSVFGAQAEAVAAVSWDSLKETLDAAGAGGLSETVDPLETGEELARALQRLAGGTGLSVLWEGLGLQGDASDFRSALKAAAASSKSWTTVAVSGRLVEGEGFTYIEPEVAVARALLSGTASDAAISVEVRNGSGAVGAVEAAAAQLQPLGYQVAAGGNADDFPNVTQTVISYAAGASDAAARVRILLGVGVVAQSDDLLLDQVVVVLGSDYAPPADATSGGTE